LVRWALRLSGRARDAGPRVAASVVIILLGAGGAQAMRIEPLFGAFVAGVLIGSARGAELPDTRPGRSLWHDLSPLRTVVLAVLAPLFLATAGLRVDLTALADPRVLIIAIVMLAVAVLGKFAGAYLGARCGRLTHGEAVALGAGMNARGVVEVVVATTGLRLGVLSVAMYTVVVLIAVVTSVLGPLVMRRAMLRVDPTESELERGRLLAVARASG
jgi:Kef-type K+ transport system membrane component KefB